MKGHQNLNDMEVYACTFEVVVNQATMAIKFPCTYTVEIKSMNNKLTMATTKNKVSAVDSVAVFNEALKFQTELLYNPKTRQFIKKDVLVLLNLISVRKPDQQKLVGRVVLDLSQSITYSVYTQPQQYKLEYCSVNASITFSVKFMGKKQSSTLPENFDRDSFSDFQSFVAGIHKQGGNKQRSFEESEKTVEMPWKSKNNEGFDRNKIIQQSNNEDAESRINTGRTSHKLLGSNENIPKPNSPNSPNLSKVDPVPEPLSSENRNLNLQKSNSHLRSLYSDNPPYEQQEVSRVKSDSFEKSNVSQKSPIQNFQPSILSQPINQYQQILRSSHAQEKRIWDEEKRLLNEQILRQKQQNFKQKERNQSLEKKVYEAELKLCNIEGKIENSKRQMAILEREKDLQIKDVKSKLERALKEKNEKTQQFDLKESQFREMKERIRNLQNEKRRTQQQLNKQQQKMHQKVEVALKRVMSSEELVNKLQRQRKENCESLLELEKKNFQLSSEINELESQLQASRNLQSQLAQLKNQMLVNEKKFNELQQKTKSEHQGQKNQLLNQLENMKKKASANDLQYELKLEGLTNEHKQQTNFLNQKIEELNTLISEGQLKQHDLYLKLEEKKHEIQTIQENFNKKLIQSQHQNLKQLQEIIAQNQGQINNLALQNEDLQRNKQALQEKLANIQKELNIKNSELEKLNNQIKDHEQLKQVREKQNKQYVENLERQILSLSEQLNKKVSECEQLFKNLEQIKNTMSQMKAYEKGLEEELLNMHDNSLQEAFNSLLQKEKKVSFQLDQFKISADQTIRQLQSNIQSLNQLISRRNHEIQKLSSEKNDTKEYILSLQTEILKYNAESESGQKLNDHLVRMQEQVSKLKQQNKQKDSEIDGLKIINIQQKEYQIGLEEQILKMNDEIQYLNANEGSHRNYSPEKPTVTFDQKQKLYSKIRELERTLEEKKIYERQLEQKILSDHKLGGNSGREEQLQDRIKELQQTIIHLKQYQQSLEEKILEDHNQIEYTNQNNQLVKKIKGQDETIQHLKEYQFGLEQKILQDHEQILKQNELKNSIKEMQATIKQQKQYQNGLQQKILQDHEIIQRLDSIHGLNQQVQTKIDPRNHEECLREKNELECKIQQLEFNLMKFTEQAQDEELLSLQKQIDNKDLYIQQLERNLRNNEKQLFELEERIAELEAYKQEHQKKGDVNQESPETIAFQTVIRIIEAHSAESEGDAVEKVELLASCSVEKESVSRSMISQPPSIRDNELAEISDQMSNKSCSQKRSEDDISPNKPMIIDDIETNPKPKPTSQLQRFNSLQVNSNPFALFLPTKATNNKPETAKQKKPSQQKSKKIRDLQAQLANKEAQLEALSKEAKENESKALKLDSQNKFYQKRIKDLQSQKQVSTQLPNKNDSYIRELQKTVEQYEHKIKALKSKEAKIQEALVIIEEESYKIVGELGQKERQCEQLKNELREKDQQIMILASSSQNSNTEPTQITKTSPEDTEQLNKLIQRNGQLQEMCANILTKLSNQQQQIKKYEQALSQMASLQVKKLKLQEENKTSKERISKLEIELKQVNGQLLTSKRLVGKLRETKQPKNSSQIVSENNNALIEQNRNLKKKMEELEEEMFSIQANENEKDIEIETLRTQAIILQQQIERAKNRNQPESASSQKEQRNVVEIVNNLKAENQELKSVIEIIKADNQQLKNTSASAELERIEEISSRQQRIKALETEISKLQNLMKTERLDYFNKRRQFNQQKEQLERKIRQHQNELDTMKQSQHKLETSNTNNEKEFESMRSELAEKIIQLEEKKEQLATKSNLVDLFENRILYLENQISNKDKEIKMLNEEIANSSNQPDAMQMKEMQHELNFYSEELAMVTKKWEEIEPVYNAQRDKIENLQKVIEELNSQLQLSNQQNEFNQQKLLKSTKAQNKQALEAKAAECESLKKRVEQISEELNFIKESHQAIEKTSSEKILELEQKCRIAETERQKAVEELEEKQMEHMNTELDLHFKLRQKNEKSQLAIGSSLTDNQLKKSLNGSQDVGASLNDIVPASKILKQLITNRSNRALAQKQIEVMVIRITQLEEQLYGASAATKEKGLILEKARLLSMEFSKIKVSVMKSKMPSEDRIKFLTSLKPFQSSIKDILNLSEIYSENLLTSDLTSEIISRS